MSWSRRTVVSFVLLLLWASDIHNLLKACAVLVTKPKTIRVYGGRVSFCGAQLHPACQQLYQSSSTSSENDEPATASSSHQDDTTRSGISKSRRYQASSSSSSSPSSSSSSPSLLQQGGGILYQTSIFDRSELATIRRDLEIHQRQMVDETTSLTVASHRLGAQIPPESPTCQILRHGSMTRWVNMAAAAAKIASSSQHSRFVLRDQEVPVEIRSYEKRGASMAWHSDDVLFDPPQLEVVWTLENTSDCVTMWRRKRRKSTGNLNDGEASHKDTSSVTSKGSSSSTNNNENKDDICTVETDPNAALLIQAGGPSHCVTSLRYGKRVIVKCVYALKDAEFLKDEYKEQFATSRKTKTSRNSRRKPSRKDR
ncbi:hypothetical protein ACA910_018062 [Epithemia clementina (nom. ined.)]